jgi:hypothetical protein
MFSRNFFSRRALGPRDATRQRFHLGFGQSVFFLNHLNPKAEHLVGALAADLLFRCLGKLLRAGKVAAGWGA